MVAIILFSCLAELFINSRALVVSYDGDWFFPTYGNPIAGKVFGLDYDHETNYRELSEKFAKEDRGNWVLMPIFPYNEYETDLGPYQDASGNMLYPPFAPSIQTKHYLGTDKAGRDIVARLVYGFRYAIAFSLLLLVCSYAIGITVGCFMGYLGGAFDLVMQSKKSLRSAGFSSLVFLLLTYKNKIPE